MKAPRLPRLLQGANVSDSDCLGLPASYLDFCSSFSTVSRLVRLSRLYPLDGSNRKRRFLQFLCYRVTWQ